MTETFDHQAEKIAHRRCTKYQHNAGPGEPMYSFTAAHLLDFARELVGESSSGNAGNVKQAARVPDGWRLVPIEPTPEMLESAKRVAVLGALNAAWHRMLSAAPAADAVAKDSELEAIRAHLAATQAHVARLVEVLRLVVKCCDEPRSRDNSEHDGLDALEAARSALSTTISLDALHEDRARECERLKNGFPQRSPLDTEAWLDREASAHRAKKEAK